MNDFADLPNRTLVLTALQLERQAVVKHLESAKDAMHTRGDIYSHGMFGSRNVLVVETGAGNIAAAQAAERGNRILQVQT